MIDLILDPTALRFITLGSLLYIGLIYFTLIVWVVIDSISRSKSFLFQLFATLLVMIFNILGLIIYMVIRPSLTLEEQRDEHIEKDYFMKQAMGERCPRCKSFVKNDYKVCPVCTHNLKTECISCNSLIYPNFRICPYCAVQQKDADKAPQKTETSKK